MKIKALALLLLAAMLPRLACAQPPEKTVEVPREKLATPEKTVRDFLDALGKNNFSTLWKYVLGAEPNQQLSPEYQQTIINAAPQFKIEQVNTTRQGDWSYVALRFQLTLQVDNRPHPVVGSSLLLLLQRDGAWQIVPASPQVIGDLEHNLVLQLVTLLVHPEALKPLRQSVEDKAVAASSLSHLKQIALATLQSVQNNDGKLLLRPESYAEQLKPYVRNDLIFYLPRTEPKEQYAFNGSLSGTSLQDIEQPWQIVMFYTGQNGKLHFLYQDRAAVAFADGHSKLVTREEARALRWKP